MVQEKTWQEFKDSKLLWWINQSLHLFGWAICLEIEDKKIKRAYPARVKFRGFDNESNSEGYAGLAKYLKENAEELEKESKL